MDYASDRKYHPIIKKGKDFAAASVLILAGFGWLVAKKDLRSSRRGSHFPSKTLCSLKVAGGFCLE